MTLHEARDAYLIGDITLSEFVVRVCDSLRDESPVGFFGSLSVADRQVVHDYLARCPHRDEDWRLFRPLSFGDRRQSEELQAKDAQTGLASQLRRAIEWLRVALASCLLDNAVLVTNIG